MALQLLASFAARDRLLLTLRYDVLPVIPKDTDFVTAAIAETYIVGSKVATPPPDEKV